MQMTTQTCLTTFSLLDYLSLTGKMIMKIRRDIRSYAKLATRNLWTSVQIELTSKCFQKCKGCSSWTDDLKGLHSGKWGFQNLKNLLEELARCKVEHVTLTGGDPQAYPEFIRLLQWWDYRKEHNEWWPDLQVNTAMTRPILPTNRDLFNRTVDELRVSLDGATEETYQYIRGDDINRPEDILEELHNLDHPSLSTMTILYPKNIHEGIPILAMLADAVGKGNLRVRKAIFLAGIGPRGHTDAEEFWHAYDEFANKVDNRAWPFKTSVDESVSEVRSKLKAHEFDEVKCWVGGMAPHIKYNGDVYPCCLVGGEAIDTHTGMKLGNVATSSAKLLMKRYVPSPDYANPVLPCTEICQWKQLQLNVAAEEASHVRLSMP